MSDLANTEIVVGDGPGAALEAPEVTQYEQFDALGEEGRVLAETWLTDEIKQVRDGEDRQQLMTRLKRWRRHRMARPEKDSKNFPFQNASNVCTPVTMSNQNAMTAKVRSMLQSRKPRIQADSNDPKWYKHGPVIGKVLNKLIDSPFHINMRKKDWKIVYETVSYGTYFVDVAWEDRVRGIQGAGGSVEPKTLYSGPMPIPTRPERVLFWSHFDDVDQMPWIAFEHQFTKFQLKQLATQGFFDPERVETMLGTPLKELEPDVDDEAKRIGISPSLQEGDSAVYQAYKVYFWHDVDGDGYPEDYIGWLDIESGQMLRSEVNQLAQRPIAVCHFFPIPDQIWGLGIGAMSEGVQEEIDSLHNIRIDSQKLASLQILARKRGASWGDDEELFPGKVIDMDDPQKDWGVFGYRDVSGSTFPAEAQARQYLDRAIGVSDGALGFSDSVMRTRATASGTIYQGQNANDILSTVFEAFLNDYEKIYMLILQYLVVNDIRVAEMLRAFCDDEVEAQLLQEVLDLEVGQIPELFKFTVKVTPEEQTVEAKRQSILMLNQLYSTMEQGLLQGYQLMASPEVPQELKQVEMKLMVGKVKLMEETMKSFGFTETDDFLPYVGVMEAMTEMVDMVNRQKAGMLKQQMAGQGGQGGAAGMAGQGQEGMGLGPEAGGAPMGMSGGPADAGLSGAAGAAPEAGPGLPL